MNLANLSFPIAALAVAIAGASIGRSTWTRHPIWGAIIGGFVAEVVWVTLCTGIVLGGYALGLWP